MTRSIALGLLVGLAACSGGSHGKVDVVNVYAFVGATDPAQGATVLAHDALGKPFQAVDADASGFASIQIVPGGTITVVFPGEPTIMTPQISLITVPAPAPDSELDVHGPPILTASAAGVLLVQPMTTIAADHYIIELGCTTSTVTQLPASITVSTLCLSKDGNLDLLVRAESNGQPVGYFADRVPIVDGFAMSTPASWQTVPPTIAVVASVPAQLDWALLADGLVFGDTTVTAAAPVYTGLVATGSRLVASQQGATTTRWTSSVPIQVNVDAGDFLPAITDSLAGDGRHYTWTPQTFSADAIDLHFEWMPDTRQITWDAILPPDAGETYVPDLGGGDLGTVVGFSNPPATLRYLDAATPGGFDALVANGVYVGTIAPRPIDGELRTTQAP